MFKTLITSMAVLFSLPANAYDLDLEGFYSGNWLSVDESYIEYRKYEAYRNPYVPDENWNFRGEFHNKFSAYKLVYWDVNLHMSMDESQIRYAGLEYYLGVKVTPWLDAIKYHHSEHVLEKEIPGNKRFPVEDSYGFRIYFKQ